MALPDVKHLSTADLDALRDAITLERAKREPQVPMEQPKTLEAAIDPRWYLSMAEANTYLQLRHPGHGWVGFLIPPASRAQVPRRTVQARHSSSPTVKNEIRPSSS